MAERLSLEELLTAPLPLLRAGLQATLAHSGVLHIPALDYDTCMSAQNVDAWRACVRRVASEASALPFLELVLPLPADLSPSCTHSGDAAASPPKKMRRIGIAARDTGAPAAQHAAVPSMPTEAQCVRGGEEGRCSASSSSRRVGGSARFPSWKRGAEPALVNLPPCSQMHAGHACTRIGTWHEDILPYLSLIHI